MAGNHMLVSIVMCTYNGAPYLHEQMESLLQQTYPSLEILIADDGSTDNTIQIANEFAARDQRVRVHVNSANLGYNKNFENAFGMASGEFIAVCDQDDVWKNNKVEKMIQLFRTPDILLVHCQSVRFTDKLPSIERSANRQAFEGNDVRKLMLFNTISGHNIMFRKKLLQNRYFPEGVFYDWWLAILAATYGKIAATDEVLTFHRFHTSNLTLGKKDEGLQTRGKAAERIHTLRAVASLPGLTTEQKNFASQLQTALSTLQQKKFSIPLFRFLSKHAAVIFFFKKKSFLSKLKMAYRMSFAIP